MQAQYFHPVFHSYTKPDRNNMSALMGTLLPHTFKCALGTGNFENGNQSEEKTGRQEHERFHGPFGELETNQVDKDL